MRLCRSGAVNDVERKSLHRTNFANHYREKRVGFVSWAMKVIVVGGGIGGLTTALMLHARGIDCDVYEQSDAIRELGVGINTVPQFSIHRGRLQAVIHQAVRARLGEARIHTGHRLGYFREDEAGVSAYFFDRHGSHRLTARGDVLVGADGIHSMVRETLYPNEGPARWNGAMLWRGA